MAEAVWGSVDGGGGILIRCSFVAVFYGVAGGLVYEFLGGRGMHYGLVVYGVRMYG